MTSAASLLLSVYPQPCDTEDLMRHFPVGRPQFSLPACNDASWPDISRAVQQTVGDLIDDNNGARAIDRLHVAITATLINLGFRDNKKGSASHHGTRQPLASAMATVKEAGRSN